MKSIEEQIEEFKKGLNITKNHVDLVDITDEDISDGSFYEIKNGDLTLAYKSVKWLRDALQYREDIARDKEKAEAIGALEDVKSYVKDAGKDVERYIDSLIRKINS